MTGSVASGPDEAQPLLSRSPRSARSKKRLILIVCSIFILSADFGLFLSAPPQIQIFEQIICRKYQENLHQTANTTQNFLQQNPCKTEAVQGELAVLNAYKDTFDILPSKS